MKKIALCDVKNGEMVHISSNGAYDSYKIRNGYYYFIEMLKEAELFPVLLDEEKYCLTQSKPKVMSGDIVQKYFNIKLLTEAEKNKIVLKSAARNADSMSEEEEATMKRNTVEGNVTLLSKNGQAINIQEEMVAIPADFTGLTLKYVACLTNEEKCKVYTVEFDHAPTGDELTYELFKAGAVSVSVQPVYSLAFKKEETNSSLEEAVECLIPERRSYEYVYGKHVNGLNDKEYCWLNEDCFKINPGDEIEINDGSHIKVTKVAQTTQDFGHKNIEKVNFIKKAAK